MFKLFPSLPVLKRLVMMLACTHKFTPNWSGPHRLLFNELQCQRTWWTRKTFKVHNLYLTSFINIRSITQRQKIWQMIDTEKIVRQIMHLVYEPIWMDLIFNICGFHCQPAFLAKNRDWWFLDHDDSSHYMLKGKLISVNFSIHLIIHSQNQSKLIILS